MYVVSYSIVTSAYLRFLNCAVFVPRKMLQLEQDLQNAKPALTLELTKQGVCNPRMKWVTRSYHENCCVPLLEKLKTLDGRLKIHKKETAIVANFSCA